MKNSNHKRGFTLIEIIVVLIIIGILAAIALPNLFSNVQRSKGSTAIAAMDGMKSQIEACAAQNNTMPFEGVCDPPTFGLSASNGFYFMIATSPLGQSATSGTAFTPSGLPSAGNLTYSIIAAEGTGGDYTPSGNIISLNRLSNGTFTCSAPNSGPYAGVC